MVFFPVLSFPCRTNQILSEEAARISPVPFFSTQILILEVESGRVIEIHGRGKETALSDRS
jgi:hypothetical protein